MKRFILVFFVFWACGVMAGTNQFKRIDIYKELSVVPQLKNLYLVTTKKFKPSEQYFLFLRYNSARWVKRYEYYPTPQNPNNENNGFTYVFKIKKHNLAFPKFCDIARNIPKGNYGVLKDGRVYVSAHWAIKNSIIGIRHYKDWLIRPTSFVPYQNKSWQQAVLNARYFIARPWLRYKTQKPYFCIMSKGKHFLCKKLLKRFKLYKHNCLAENCNAKNCSNGLIGVTTNGILFVNGIFTRTKFLDYIQIRILKFTMIKFPMIPVR